MSRIGVIAAAVAVLLGVGWMLSRPDDEEAANLDSSARREVSAGRAAGALPGRQNAGRPDSSEPGARGSLPGAVTENLDERLRHARGRVGARVPEIDADVADADGKLFDPFGIDDRGERPIEATLVEFVPGDGVVLGDDSALIFPADGNVDGTAGTITFVIEPEWSGADDSNRGLVRIDRPDAFQSRIQVMKNGEYLRYMFIDSNGADRNLTYSIAAWEPGESHQVSVTWGGGRLVLYVDGAEAAQLDFAGEIDLGADSQLAVGSTTVDGFSGAGARITDFTVYDHPIAPGEL